MKKIYLLSLLAMAFCALNLNAQKRIYSNPFFITESTKGIEIYFDATGTDLANESPNAKIYAYTGVYTNKDKTNWQGAGSWGDDQRQLTNVGTRLWMLYIPGTVREYYGITNPAEQVTQLNFVFKTPGKDGAKQTEDLFLPVYADGLQVSLESDAESNIISGETCYVTFTVNVTELSDIVLTVNQDAIAMMKNSLELIQAYTFTEPGTYDVTATATNSQGETASQTITFNYIQDSPQVDYPGGTPKMGPVVNEDGSVTFCLGAIGKKHVALIGSWNDYAFSEEQVMSYQDTPNGRYFWTTVYGLDPDKKYVYYFIIDGGEYIVGDPYARLILDPYSDTTTIKKRFPDLPDYPVEALNGQNVPVAIYQGSLNDYDWVVEDFDIPDHFNLIIYELLFRDFTGTENRASGNGTVKLAIEKLPYLKTLGVNAIELLPICEFNGNNSWGYNPNFYFAADKQYGTPDDYKEFIDLCHQNGIAVILDMVFNQTDWLHPWYQMYKTGSNPYYNADAPHAYSVLNDINQGNPMIQEQWADVLQYWMKEYKVDGFRFDLVKGLGTNDSYPNNSGSATNQYNASRVKEMLYLQSAMQEINPRALFINENLATAQEENEMSNKSYAEYDNMQINWANINGSAQQFVKGISSNSGLERMYAPKDGRVLGSTVSYLESHDEERLAYVQDQYGASGVKGNVVVSCQRLGSAAAQMLMAPGAHMIWQFSEMGNAQSTKDSNGGNNTGTKIVNWKLLEEPNHRGLYDNYCEMINIRMNNPEMFSKDAIENGTFDSKCTGSTWALGRYLKMIYQGKELYTFINPTVSSAITIKNAFETPDNSAYQILSKSYNSNPSFDAVAGTVSVPANCYVIIGSASLEDSGVDAISLEETKLNVIGGNGEIVILSATQDFIVYSLDGKVVAKGAENGKVSVASGLYIVRSGKDAVKVLVK